jgi:cytosine/adenosine deaminase-related metal-dependent hydrolase
VTVTFINASLAGGRIGSLRVTGSRIAALDAPPQSSDVVVYLDGDRLLPGLINAHDHLQLNSLLDHEPVHHYQHVRDWIAEIDARRRTDPQFKNSVAVAREERLLLGGIKNLLSGVTTVAHHDPLYASLTHGDYPISVVRDYGWSHSLYIDGEQKVARAYRSTPSEWPWIVHAAEGLNREAAEEFERLDALGCVQPNTLLVHGIALDHAQRARLRHLGAGLIWCPSSNLRLFGKTAQVSDLISHGRIALGTDSRLSGSRDMLEELRIAADTLQLDEFVLEDIATQVGAKLLRLADRGTLQPGMRADLFVLPPRTRLGSATRAHVRLVMIGGIVRYGDAGCVTRASPDRPWTRVWVDGVPKMLDVHLAATLACAQAREPGLEISQMTGRAA